VNGDFIVSMMKNGVIVLLAIVFGVLLIGIVPNQVSNLGSSTELKSIISRTPSGSGNILNDTNDKTQIGSSGVNENDEVVLDGNIAPNNVIAMDLQYYSLWALNVFIAFLVFFTARRRMQ
jgi:acyl-CoA synthetase (AMP-forming)/AMP-acid ligase II